MEILMVIIAGCLISMSNGIFFFLGVKTGEQSKPEEGVKISKQNAEILKQYANLYTYQGDER